MYQQYNYQYQIYPMYTQMQVNKQLVSLRQDQDSSNLIMCRVLSELENLAFCCGYEGQKIFGYYSTISKDFQEIINQIIFQMTIFESSYTNFKKNSPNKQYEFPNNLNFNSIIDIVNKWKNFVKKQRINHNYDSYYDEFLNILLNNNLSKSFNQQFQNIDKDSQKMTNADLNRVMNAGATATCFINEKYNEIEREISEKGDYKVNVILGGDRKNNKFYNIMDSKDETFNSLKKELYYNLKLLLGYLELYINSKGNNYSNKIIKYSNEIKVKNNTDVYAEYSKYLDKLDDIYNKIYDEFNFTIPDKEKEEIEKHIKLLKRNTNDPNAKNECSNVINFICKNKSPIKK
jgi:hypothetical protein